jgi:tRNA(Ile)-lysidine synthase
VRREGALPTVAVAASGGRDSTALLHATARAARTLGLKVVALHVHHGLSPHADAWLSHLRAQCQRWRRAGWPVFFDSRRLTNSPRPGESVEAWARAGRYAALAEMAQAHGATILLLAHHRRDQAETVLLQALRGAGSAGLSGMPALARRAGLTWARPWLDQPAERVQAYVQRHRLSHVEDDSNQDTRFDRNRLRSVVWPSFLQAFPQAEGSLCQVARHAQRAATLMVEVATEDLLLLRTADGDLLLAGWLNLSAARRWGVLQAWLQHGLLGGVPDTLLQRLMDELPGAHSGARWPAQAGGWIRLYRGLLRLHKAAQPVHVDSGSVPSVNLRLDKAGCHGVPEWHGHILVTAVSHGGLAGARLQDLCARARRGGDQFQAQPGSLPRSLKKQFQSAGVPAWLREGPVVEDASGRLLWVAGLGIDGRAQAPPGAAPQFKLTWVPDAGA